MKEITRNATLAGSKHKLMKLGFQQGIAEGRKVVQLTFLHPDSAQTIMYRIPFITDGSDRMTLLLHQAVFAGDRESAAVPESIRQAAHSRLNEWIGESGGDEAVSASAGYPERYMGQDAFGPASGTALSCGSWEEDGLHVESGMMVQDASDLIRLGKEMKAMKTNTELEEDGMIPDPIQR